MTTERTIPLRMYALHACKHLLHQLGAPALLALLTLTLFACAIPAPAGACIALPEPHVIRADGVKALNNPLRWRGPLGLQPYTVNDEALRRLRGDFADPLRSGYVPLDALATLMSEPLTLGRGLGTHYGEAENLGAFAGAYGDAAAFDQLRASGFDAASDVAMFLFMASELGTGGGGSGGDSGGCQNPLLFGQPSVKARFAHGRFAGRSIGEIAEYLRLGKISPDELPIEFITRDGQRVALNNRSLTALRRARMSPTNLIDRTGIDEFEGLLDRHLGGTEPSPFIRIRGGPPGTSNLE